MGTNFYWIDADKVGVPNDLPGNRHHLGKRSAAGYFCASCHVPLVQNGDKNLVHLGKYPQLENCPVCGKKRPPFNFNSSSGAIELGFKKPKKGRQTRGIHSCCSFSWAQEKIMVQAICEQWKDQKVIEDEYGDEFTGQEFMEMIFSNCPIEYEDSVGREFS